MGRKEGFMLIYSLRVQTVCWRGNGHRSEPLATLCLWPETKKMGRHSAPFLLHIQSRSPVQGMVLPTSRSISTVQLKFSRNILTDTPQDVFSEKF